MSIKIYGEPDEKVVKVFFRVDDSDNVVSVAVGNSAVNYGKGFQFYVDDYVAEQIHKFNLKMDGLEPKLELKEGEQLFVPEECEAYKKQKEIEELEQRLQQLKAD